MDDHPQLVRSPVLPRSATLHLGLAFLLGVVAMLGVVLDASVMLPAPPTLGTGAWVTAALVSLWAGWMAWFGWYTSRVRRRLAACDWRLFPKCSQDLSGLGGDPWKCPECGREWTRRQIELSWEKIVGRRTRANSGGEL